MGKWDNVYKAFHTVSGIMQVPNKFVRVIYFGDFSVLLGYFILNKNFSFFYWLWGCKTKCKEKKGIKIPFKVSEHFPASEQFTNRLKQNLDFTREYRLNLFKFTSSSVHTVEAHFKDKAENNIVKLLLLQ